MGMLAKYGARFINNGYRIVPILPGEKNPIELRWTDVAETPADLRVLNKWLNPNYRHPKSNRLLNYALLAGIGIITENNPAIDIDVLDETVSSQMEQFVTKTIGFGAMVRVGRAPKRLILCRTTETFSKLSSVAYLDHRGNKAQVEILAKGQQFVAAGIHEKTGKPYRWLYGENPATTESDELPTLNAEQARQIIIEFERLAAENSWTVESKRRDVVLSNVDTDNPFAADKAKTVISNDELHRKLLMIPNEAADYDTWLNIGMALYHQYDGSDEGLELWQQWSEQSSKHQTEANIAKWPSFDISVKGRQPLTARYIIKLADEEAKRIAVETYAEIVEGIEAISTLPAFADMCERIKHIEFSALQRDQLRGFLTKRYKKAFNLTISITTLREAIRYEAPEVRDVPTWLQNWVYCQLDETFFNIDTRHVLTRQAFNDTFGRNCLTKRDVLEGRAVPENSPIALALNLHQIEVVHNRMYLPQEESLFTANGRRFANLYDPREVPTTPERLTKADLDAIQKVDHHFTHMFDVERERELLKDYFAYLVQSNDRVNWCPLVQGTESDGKSFFYTMMASCLGWSNVKTVGAKALEGEFNAFLEGTQLVFVEELKLQGHNRFDVLNAIKTAITNPVVPIRRMRTDIYEVINTASMFATTNFRDALPLTANDTRYFVLYSRFQNLDQVDTFNKANPDYYDELFAAVSGHAPAIRKWLLDRQLSPEFNAKKRAPKTKSKTRMISNTMSDELEALHQVLAERKSLSLTADLLCAADLADAMQNLGVENVPYGKAMNKFLNDNGFSKIGSKQIRVDDRVRRFWSRNPDLFSDQKGEAIISAIRSYLDPDSL